MFVCVCECVNEMIVEADVSESHVRNKKKTAWIYPKSAAIAIARLFIGPFRF